MNKPDIDFGLLLDDVFGKRTNRLTQSLSRQLRGVVERIEQGGFAYINPGSDHSDLESLYGLKEIFSRSLDGSRISTRAATYQGMINYSRQDGEVTHLVSIARFSDGSGKVSYTFQTDGPPRGFVEVDPREFLRGTKSTNIVDFFDVKIRERQNEAAQTAEKAKSVYEQFMQQQLNHGFVPNVISVAEFESLSGLSSFRQDGVVATRSDGSGVFHIATSPANDQVRDVEGINIRFLQIDSDLSIRASGILSLTSFISGKDKDDCHGWQREYTRGVRHTLTNAIGRFSSPEGTIGQRIGNLLSDLVHRPS